MKTKARHGCLIGCGLLVALTFLIIVVGIVVIFYPSVRSERIAKNPEKIVHEAGWTLPSYSVVSQDDNMDRGASAWSSYWYQLQLDEPLSDKDKAKLDKLVAKDSCWQYSPDTKEYHYYLSEEERGISIKLNEADKSVIMEYEWYDAFF